MPPVIVLKPSPTVSVRRLNSALKRMRFSYSGPIKARAAWPARISGTNRRICSRLPCVTSCKRRIRPAKPSSAMTFWTSMPAAPNLADSCTRLLSKPRNPVAAAWGELNALESTAMVAAISVRLTPRAADCCVTLGKALANSCNGCSPPLLRSKS